MSNQPEALRLANKLERGTYLLSVERNNTAAELRRLHAECDALREALRDMHAGWKYIRSFHGDLYGVGWDRRDEKARAALKEPK